ncbi:unnamed protein product [Urochloa humidicola]
MNALAWNCRGLGNPQTVRELCDLVKLHRPKLVFLSETRMSSNRSSNFRWRLGLRHSLAVSSDGLSGGLVLFWDESINVTLLSQGERYIDVPVTDDVGTAPWRATFVYGEPRVEKRKDMWDLMRLLCGEWQGPWVLLGDFNEAMWQYEHFSETPRVERQMMDFREVLGHCDLHDLGFSCLPWTYNNNQGGRRNVRVRLDRGVANSEWSLRWPAASIDHLTTAQSDHKALLLAVQPDEPQTKGCRVFRYEIMWEREEALGTFIAKAWQKKNPGSDLGALVEGLKIVTRDLKQWSSEKFGHVTKKLEKLRRELDTLEYSDPIQNHEAILKTKRELDELLYREEMIWMQRSRISWLREGDRNTKYFHQKARWRARKNRIKKLKREDGSWTSDQNEMQGMAKDYFTDLFLRDNDVDPQELIDLLDPRITDDINRDLCKPYSVEEISDAMFQIGPLKAPGPDGFPARFFQRNWPVLKEDIVRAVQEFFCDRSYAVRCE